jgi:hypothetical protein
LPASRHRLVRQANDDEGGQAIGYLDLNLDRQDLDALEGDGMDMGSH